MKEIFKTIPSFPDYEVSNFGRVKTRSRRIRYTHARTGEEHFRVSTSRLLKIYFNKYTGYKFCQPYLNGKAYNKPIHQLVAETFLVKDDGMEVVNHIDGNKHNNTVSNLEWCTNEYNHRHATITGLKAKGQGIASSKLNNNCVHAIKYLISIGFSHSEIAKMFLMSRSAITLIANEKTWKHVALTGKELEMK